MKKGQGSAGSQIFFDLINADVLDALGPKGHLVNVGRGTVVDTAALIDALKARRIAGVALDVVEGEPVLPASLLEFDNVLITPHCAGECEEYHQLALDVFMNNLHCYLEGRVSDMVNLFTHQ